jgi:hypothetical protein
MFLDGGWEYMPFGTMEVVDRYHWEPLFGSIEVVAAAIGNARKMWLVIEREGEGSVDEIWWWLIYWRSGNRMYLLSVRNTHGAFVAVV